MSLLYIIYKLGGSFLDTAVASKIVELAYLRNLQVALSERLHILKMTLSDVSWTYRTYKFYKLKNNNLGMVLKWLRENFFWY